MRIILCCLGLLFSAPAFASAVEDGLCHARPQPVEKMERSEKLCRAFVRAIGKLPGETMREVQALLSPESLALMGTMTTAWVGSQGIPVLGQTVSLAIAGGRSGDGRAPPENAKPKRVDLEAFKSWLEKVKRRPVPESREAYQYQRKHAGPEELMVSGGGAQVWTDGARLETAKVVEVKHVGDAGKSPFIAGSTCDEGGRLAIQRGVTDEFERYAAVIKDPNTPIVALEVIINDMRAVPFFESLLTKFGIPGEVLVRP
jgi:hypothetical protein